MKQCKWPRPPLILGVVLGDTIERYMFISIERYGLSWLLRPIVALLFILAILGLVRPLLQDIRRQGGLKRMLMSFQAPRFHPSQLFTVFMIVVIGAAVAVALRWDFSAKVVPLVVGTVALTAARSACSTRCAASHVGSSEGLSASPARSGTEDSHGPDLRHRTPAGARDHRAGGVVLRLSHRLHGGDGDHRAHSHGGGVRRVLHAMEARERWTLVVPYTAALILFIWFTFDYVMSVPWPPTLLGQWYPAFKAIPSV
jgi:hypothetical protein